MKAKDEFYPELIFKLYFNNQLDRKIKQYHYNWKEKYNDDDYYDNIKGIGYDKVYVQQNTNYDATSSRAVQIADLKLYAERRYKYLSKAKKSIKELLDNYNEQQKRELNFYFEYEDDLEQQCISLAKNFSDGREDYKKIKKLVRESCNKLDKKLLN